MDLMSAMPSDRSYWTYRGSLTKPPCTENVAWVILEQTMRISLEQVHKLLSCLPSNLSPPVAFLPSVPFRSSPGYVCLEALAQRMGRKVALQLVKFRFGPLSAHFANARLPMPLNSRDIRRNADPGTDDTSLPWDYDKNGPESWQHNGFPICAGTPCGIVSLVVPAVGGIRWRGWSYPGAWQPLCHDVP